MGGSVFEMLKGKEQFMFSKKYILSVLLLTLVNNQAMAKSRPMLSKETEEIVGGVFKSVELGKLSRSAIDRFDNVRNAGWAIDNGISKLGLGATSIMQVNSPSSAGFLAPSGGADVRNLTLKSAVISPGGNLHYTEMPIPTSRTYPSNVRIKTSADLLPEPKDYASSVTIEREFETIEGYGTTTLHNLEVRDIDGTSRTVTHKYESSFGELKERANPDQKVRAYLYREVSGLEQRMIRIKISKAGKEIGSGEFELPDHIKGEIVDYKMPTDATEITVTTSLGEEYTFGVQWLNKKMSYKQIGDPKSVRLRKTIADYEPAIKRKNDNRTSDRSLKAS